MKPLSCLVLLLCAVSLSARAASLKILSETGDRAQRINLVFLSEGYTKTGLSTFEADATRAVEFLFGREPWTRYRSYCNVYGIAVASTESGTDNGQDGASRDTYFETGFNDPGVSQLLAAPEAGQRKAYTLLNELLPEYDIAVILVNDAKYGGSGGPIAVVSLHASSGGILEHELGHSFAGLADEYANEYAGYYPREMPNTTARTNRDQIVWRHWIDAAVALPTKVQTGGSETVGLYEGSMYRATGWYRPHQDSLMRHLFKPCGAVNQEQFVLSNYELVEPIDSATPLLRTVLLVGNEAVPFSVQPMRPAEGDPLSVAWEVDGKPQPDATNETLLVTAAKLGTGLHTVRVVVHDSTDMVRDDPKNLLSESVTWTVTAVDTAPASLTEWRQEFGPDDATPADDGVNNLLKYALGLDPATPALPEQMPYSSLKTGSDSELHLVLNVPRNVVRTDIDYVPESSADLFLWTSETNRWVILRDDASGLVVQDAEPISAHATGFIRLRIVPRQ